MKFSVVLSILYEATHHSLDSSLGASNLDARTAVGSAAPLGSRVGSAIDSRGERVGREHAVSSSEVTTVPGRRSSDVGSGANQCRAGVTVGHSESQNSRDGKESGGEELHVEDWTM